MDFILSACMSGSKFSVYSCNHPLALDSFTSKLNQCFFLNLVHASFKPVTDEQVFYDKFSYDKFYLPSARVNVRQILYDKFLVF